MRTPMRLLASALSAIALLTWSTVATAAPGDPAPASTTQPSTAPATASATEGTPEVSLGQGPIPSGTSGKKVEVSVPLINRGKGTAVGLLVSPKPAVDPATFPFEITQTDYTVGAGDLEPAATTDVKLGTFTLRSGLASGYYALPLSIQYGDTSQRLVTEHTIFVHVSGVAKPDPEAPSPVTTTTPKTVEAPAPAAGRLASGQSANPGPSAVSGSGPGAAPPAAADNGNEQDGENDTPGSTPRVMLTSFRSTPHEVMAGENFGITFTLTNMSSRTAVGNIKVTVNSGEGSLLPVTGASSVYIESIGAKRSASRSLEFRALPTLEERPYPLSLSIEYEDRSNQAPLSAEESVAVLIKQRVRAETSGIDVTPTTVMVGQEASISFTLQNLGKVPLYNVRASVADGLPISGDEVFVGNVEPGTSGNVDMLVTADLPTAEPVTVTITYEDATGTAATMERTVDLLIEDDVSTGPGMEDEVPEETAAPSLLSLLMVPFIVLLLIAGAIIAAVVVARRRKRRREQALAQHLAEADAEPFYPQDPQ
ncbi:MAG: COG1361 S-layer family protein [Propioniciclava sp.]